MLLRGNGYKKLYKKVTQIEKRGKIKDVVSFACSQVIVFIS